MSDIYEKPTIARQIGGITNKFGNSNRSCIQTEIAGVSIAELTAEYGSPLFVYSEQTIEDKYSSLLTAFSRRYPKVQPAWSYKTNYLQAICTSFHRLGSWAEVVSTMEYEMARNNGLPAEKIIFNGPFKPYAGLKIALEEGAMVNIDSMDELFDVEKIADELGRPVQVGIRLNMSLGNQKSWDRFGFNLDSGHAWQAVKRAAVGGKVEIVGVHAHIGTFILDADLYRVETEKLVGFCQRLQNEFGQPVKYLDIGGGFASPNRLKGTYLSTSDNIPTYDDYAEAITGALLSGFSATAMPLLILESGRSLIDEAGSLVTSVVASKRMGNGLRGLVLDAGVNLLFTSFWYDHEVIPTVDRGPTREEHILYGPLCMQIDVIRERIRLPQMQRGDQLVIRPVGAYNNTQWMQFIHLRPNVVMIGVNGEVSLIRSAETVADLQHNERIPAWMKESPLRAIHSC